MKTSLFIVPAIITLASSFAMADDHKKFSDVDMNKDGKLSVSEAKVALPGLKLETSASSTDATLLTRAEVEKALPQISFEDGEDTDPITEEEYDDIVEELEERGMTASTSTSTATGAAAASSTRPAASADRAGADTDAEEEEDRNIDLNNDGDDDVDADVDLGDNADDDDSN